MREAVQLSKSTLAVITACCLAACAHAAADPGVGNIRYEVSIGVNGWPDVEDLQPLSPDKLDETGFDLGGAVHWPLKQIGDGDLRLGFNVGLFLNQSGIIAGGGYLVPSVKWRPDVNRGLSLDAGLGYYTVNFAEIAGDASLFFGPDVWKKNGLGGFVGATWSIASARRAKSHGLMLSFKVHFVDLGTIDGQDLLPPVTLSADAGKLDRGFYQLQLGYCWE